MGRRRRRQEGVIKTEVGTFRNYGCMLLLFETPSGFAIFTTSEIYLFKPNALEVMWAKFVDEYRANYVVFLEEFQTFEDKSSAINADTGVNRQLADMIKRWHSRGMKLAVGKPEYETIIGSELGIPCVYNAIVMEFMWGIQRLMHKLVPEEKSELTKEDRLPMCQGLKMVLSRYGFDVGPEMVNEQIIVTARALFDCDAVDNRHLTSLRNAGVHLEVISGINCEHWDALKLATALKVLGFPQEKIDFHEVFAQDELSKLKAEAPKYKNIVTKDHCLKTYRELVSAHQVRIAKKNLLASLVKEANEAREAEQVREKGKLQGEPEQIPQEHVTFANICRMILSHVLPKVRDSAFEPIVGNEPIFCEVSSLGGTVSRRIAKRSSFFEAQPLTSKAESQSQNIDRDAGHNTNVGKSVLAPLTEPMEQSELLGIEATPLASVRVSEDEAMTAELLAEHSEQNEVNILENVHQSAHAKSSLQQEQVQAHVSLPTTPLVSNPSTPLVGKVVRRSSRLKRKSDYQHVKLEDTHRKRCKKVAAPPSSSLSLDN